MTPGNAQEQGTWTKSGDCGCGRPLISRPSRATGGPPDGRLRKRATGGPPRSGRLRKRGDSRSPLLGDRGCTRHSSSPQGDSWSPLPGHMRATAGRPSRGDSGSRDAHEGHFLPPHALIQISGSPSYSYLLFPRLYIFVFPPLIHICFPPCFSNFFFFLLLEFI